MHTKCHANDLVHIFSFTQLTVLIHKPPWHSKQLSIPSKILNNATDVQTTQVNQSTSTHPAPLNKLQIWLTLMAALLQSFSLSSSLKAGWWCKLGSETECQFWLLFAAQVGGRHLQCTSKCGHCMRQLPSMQKRKLWCYACLWVLLMQHLGHTCLNSAKESNYRHQQTPKV